MDDTDLKQLVVKPGKLEPKFKSNQLQYTLILGSDDKSCTFTCDTSNPSASYDVKASDGQRGKVIKVEEGKSLDIKVLVIAEDGDSTKTYIVTAKRQSASDARLLSLKLSFGTLRPEFNPEEFVYHAEVPCSSVFIGVKYQGADDRSKIILKDGSNPNEILLNLGQTRIQVQVASPNESTTQIYTVFVTKRQIPFALQACEPIQFQLLDPLSGCFLHRPVKFRFHNRARYFSLDLYRHLTYSSGCDPLTGAELPKGWAFVDQNTEAEVSNTLGVCPFSSYGCSYVGPLRAVASHLKSCENMPMPEYQGASEACSSCKKLVPKCDGNFHKSLCLSSKTFQHAIEKDRPWEKRLHQVVAEKSVAANLKNGNDRIANYLSERCKEGLKSYHPTLLRETAEFVAAACRDDPKTFSNHRLLGTVLEELARLSYYYGILDDKMKKEGRDENVEAEESSKEDESMAIAVLHGFPKHCTQETVLKALEKEYHQLIDSGQGAKAEHVQALHAWKSKKVMLEGHGAVGHVQDDLVMQSVTKLKDALSLKTDDLDLNMQTGRMMMMAGQYSQALERFAHVLSLKPTCPEARLYYSASLAHYDPKKNVEASHYLKTSLPYLFLELFKEVEGNKDTPPASVLGGVMYDCTNVPLLTAMLQLAQDMPPKYDQRVPEKWTALREVTSLCTNAIVRVRPRTTGFTELYQLLLRIRWNTMRFYAEGNRVGHLVVCSTGHILMNVMKNHDIGVVPAVLNAQVDALQGLACQMPRSPNALAMLGEATFSRFQTLGDEGDIADCEILFTVAIEMEKDNQEGPIPSQLSKMKWWKERQKLIKDNATIDSDKDAGVPTVPATSNIQSLKSSAVAPSTKPSTAKPGPAKPGPAAPPAKKGPASPTPAPAKKGAAVKPEAEVVTLVPAQNRAEFVDSLNKMTPEKRQFLIVADTEVSHSTHSVAVAIPPEDWESETNLTPSTHCNSPSAVAHLGLARVLGHNRKDPVKSLDLYKQVISFMPKNHDAYIEMADLLERESPMEAAAVLMRYPFPPPEAQTTADGYIHGEIVRMIFKAKEYDDQRVENHMVSYAKIMGISCLDKYVRLLEDNLKMKTLKKVFAAINGKPVDDPEMKRFYDIRHW